MVIFTNAIGNIISKICARVLEMQEYDDNVRSPHTFPEMQAGSSPAFH